MKTIKGILRGEVITLNEVPPKAKIKTSQITEYDGVKYFNPDGAEITPDVKAKPSKYHKRSGSKWILDTSKKSEVIKQVIEKINADTTEKIYNGIDYEGVRFYLTAENQRNFAELDRNRADLRYPYTVWSGENEIRLADADEVHTLYKMGFLHISVCLENGRDAKKAARAKTTAELLETLKS